MAAQLASGWYPDPNDDSAEIYWDGTRWHGRREIAEGDAPPRPEQVTPEFSVAGVRNLPTRKFWITTIALISLALLTIFWIIPKINETNEHMKQSYKMMYEKCLDEKRSGGMDTFKSMEECKHWIE